MYYSDFVNEGTYLAHFGIKGMKWGVRRFQDEDGSLTPEGKRRYKYDVEGSKAKYELAKAEYKKRPTGKLATQMQLAKDEYINNKVKEKLSQETGITEHRRKLESYFKDQGMTPEEAQIAAYKRAKTEKVVVGALAVAAVTAGVIVAKKHYDKNVDGMINKGVKLHRVTQNETEDTERAFYASYKLLDRMKYRGMYGTQLGGLVKDDLIYDVTLETNSKIKIASPKHAREALETILRNDPSAMNDFKQALDTRETMMMFGLGGNAKQRNAIKAAQDSLDKGIINDNVYKAYNFMLSDHGGMQHIHDSFFSTLKNNGYGAIVDVNDTLFSGYNAKKPVIVFGGSSAVSKTASKSLKSNSIKRDLIGSAALSVGKGVSGIGAAVGTFTGARRLRSEVSRNNRLNSEALQYREQHPNTRMTLEQIRRMLEEQRYVR